MLKTGSSLLMVTLLISLVGIMVTTAWRVSLYNLDITSARIQEQKYLAAAEGALNIGIGIAQENFDALLTRGETLSLDLSKDESGTERSILIQPNQTQINIQAAITNSEKRKINIACSIIQQFNKDDSSFLHIENWRYQV